jgi:hypothetical protein
MDTRKPHRQICSVCHREYGIDFQVPDHVWELATHRSQRNDLICLDCFARMADTRFVAWEEGLRIYPTSLITHIENHRAAILPEAGGQ